MATKYLIPLKELLDKAAVKNFKNSSLQCKHFFSGAAVYVNGNICMSSACAEMVSRSATADFATKLSADEPGEAPKRKFWSEDGSLIQERGHGLGRGAPLTPAGFALKLPEKSRKKLLQEKGVKLLRYFPKAPIKKDYVVLPQRMLDNTRIFRYWVRKSIEYIK